MIEKIRIINPEENGVPAVRERYKWKDGVKRPERPMDLYLNEVLDKLSKNQVSIVQAETGVGKTSRIPQAILDSDPNAKIYMTQPRRVATRMNAKYIASEMGQKLGKDVDYSLRNERQGRRNARLELLIDQSLVNRIIKNKKLPEGYIIIDEAHERSVEIDKLLILIRTFLPNSPKTKILITSATIDTQKFAKYFDYSLDDEKYDITPATAEPTIAFNEKLFPVERNKIFLRKNEHHSDVANEMAKRIFAKFMFGKNPSIFLDSEKSMLDVRGANNSLNKHDYLSTQGDTENGPRIKVEEGIVLVFLPGKEDIEAGIDGLEQYARKIGGLQYLDILPYYRDLPLSEKSKLEAPIKSGVLRVVFTTEILKSSVTPPMTVGIIDSFQVKRMIANENGVSTLTKISQSGAEADQAGGRTGRECSGFDLKVLGHTDEVRLSQTSLEYWPTPAIIQEGVITVILELAAADIDIVTAKMLDRPDGAVIDKAISRLQGINALDEERRITEFGRELLQFSISPEKAKSLFEGYNRGVLPETMIVVASLDQEGFYFLPGKGKKEITISQDTLKGMLEEYFNEKWKKFNGTGVGFPISNREELDVWLKDRQISTHGEVKYRLPEFAYESISYPMTWRVNENIIENLELIDKMSLGDYLKLYLHDEVTVEINYQSWKKLINDKKELLSNLAEIQKNINIKRTETEKSPVVLSIPDSVVEKLDFPISYNELELLLRDLNITLEGNKSIAAELGINLNYDFATIKSTEFSLRTNREVIPRFMTDVIYKGVSGGRFDDDVTFRRNLANSIWRNFAINPETNEHIKSDFYLLVNVFRSYKAEQRRLNMQYSGNDARQRLNLWCMANYINTKKLRYIENQIRDFTKEIKKSPLTLDTSIYDNRDFDVDELTKSILAGLVENVCLGSGTGPKSTNMIIGNNSTLSGSWGMYVFGGIRKQHHQGRGEDRYFTELCAPIRAEWLEELSPYLYDESSICNTSTISFDGKVQRKYALSYFGQHFDKVHKVLSGSEASKIIFDLLLDEKLDHKDLAHIQEVRKEVKDLLIRDQNELDFDEKLKEFLVEKINSEDNFNEVKDIDLVISEDDLAKILNKESYKKYKESVYAERPSEWEVKGSKCRLAYLSPLSRKEVMIFIPLSVIENISWNDLPGFDNFDILVNINDTEYSGLPTLYKSSGENFDSLKENIESTRLNIRWSQFVKEKDYAYIYDERATYRPFINGEKVTIQLEALDEFPDFEDGEIWDEQTGSIVYFYYLNKYGMYGSVDWDLYVTKDKQYAHEKREEAEIIQEEKAKPAREKRDREKNEVLVLELILEIEAVYDQIRYTVDSEKFGLTDDETMVKTWADVEINIPKKLRRAKDWTKFSSNRYFLDGIELLQEIKARLDKALDFYQSQGGNLAKFKEVIRRKKEPILKIDRGYGAAILISFQETPDGYTPLMRTDDETNDDWGIYKGFLSSEFNKPAKSIKELIERFLRQSSYQFEVTQIGGFELIVEEEEEAVSAFDNARERSVRYTPVVDKEVPNFDFYNSFKKMGVEELFGRVSNESLKKSKVGEWRLALTALFEKGYVGVVSVVGLSITSEDIVAAKKTLNKTAKMVNNKKPDGYMNFSREVNNINQLLDIFMLYKKALKISEVEVNELFDNDETLITDFKQQLFMKFKRNDIVFPDFKDDDSLTEFYFSILEEMTT